MKSLFKSALFMMAGAIGAFLFSFSFKEIGLSEVTAQSANGFVKPTLVASQGTQRNANAPEMTTQIEYALPMDLNLFQIVGAIPQNSNIQNARYIKAIHLLPIHQDVNGDGLLDMVYAYYFNGYWNNASRDITEQYVLLNNGRGYDLVYWCERNFDDHNGDCASL